MVEFVNRWCGGGGGSEPTANYDHVKEHKSTQKSLAPHFTSNKPLALMPKPLKD